MRTLWRLIASFFKWTWRILNFIRKLALNAIFLVLVLVYRYLEPVQQHHQRTCRARRAAPGYYRRGGG